MFCRMCGAENSEGSSFCSNCGASLRVENKPVGAAASSESVQTNVAETPAEIQTGTVASAAPNTAPTVAPTAPKKSKKKRNIIIASVVSASLVTIVAGILILVFALGGRGPEATIKQYFNAVEKGDVDSIMDLIPDEVWDSYDKDKLEDGIEKLKDEFRGSENYDISYKIREMKDLDRDDVEDLIDDYEDDGIKIKISAAKKAKVDITVKLKGSILSEDNDDYSYDDTETFTLIKVGKSWYFDEKNMF